MKAITLRLPDIEAVTLPQMQKVARAYRDLQSIAVQQIRAGYQKMKIGLIASTLYSRVAESVFGVNAKNGWHTKACNCA